MKHNNAYLCGWVREKPKVVYDEKENKYIFSMGRIETIRGIRRYGTKTDNIRIDEPLIYCEDQEICKTMSQWEIGDIVEIKGALTTKDVNKRTVCVHCEHKNVQPGNVVFVTPIHCYIRERGVNTQELAKEKLKTLCEVSNNITIIGVVCREPALYKSSNSKLTSYQLAVRRKFRIQQEGDNANTDFPWVKSFGSIGANDALMLKRGSYVFLDGWLQTRKFQRETTCENCGKTYKWNDWALEIVPYASEYVRNCRTKEEIEEADRQRIEMSYREMYDYKVDPYYKSPIENPEEIEAILDKCNTTGNDADPDGVRKLANYEDLK